MDDVQAIRAIALDDIEGWYTADADRMDHVLSDHLAKRRIVSASEIWHVDTPWMVSATAEGKGSLTSPRVRQTGCRNLRSDKHDGVRQNRV